MFWFRMMVLATCALGAARAYSGGAPVEVCKDMIPKHPAAPQKSPMPYTITTNSNSVAPGGVVKVTISGKDDFKGYLIQARKGSEPVGKWLISGDDRFSKTIDCDGEQVMFEMLRQFIEFLVPEFKRLYRGNMLQNAATHKNSFPKNNLSLEWQAPAGSKDEVQFYVTVALDGGTYWVHQPTAKVTVK